MAEPYVTPNNGTFEYEYARQATAPRGIMGLANTSIGQAPPPTNAAVIGAIANSPPPAGYVPSYQEFMNRSVADQLFGPAYRQASAGGPPPMGGPVRPVMGIPIGPQPYRHGMWADRTMHIGYDPNTGQMSATHLTGFNSPYPYVVRGGPVPVGSFSAPLMASLLSGIQIGPRNGYAPVAPRMGGGPAVGGGPGPGSNAQKTATATATEEKPAAETPPGAEKTPSNVPLKTLMHPEQDAQWYNERGDPNEDYRVDLGDRIRYTARQEGMKDWQTADEADLARRLQANGYVIRDVRGPAAVKDLSNLEASRDVYNAPNRDVNSSDFRQALASGQDLYTMYRQQGYSHADASNMVTQSLHAQYQNRLLDRSIDEYLREQDPASFTTSGASPTVGPNQVVGYYANPQNVMRDRRNIY